MPPPSPSSPRPPQSPSSPKPHKPRPLAVSNLVHQIPSPAQNRRLRIAEALHKLQHSLMCSGRRVVISLACIAKPSRPGFAVLSATGFGTTEPRARLTSLQDHCKPHNGALPPASGAPRPPPAAQPLRRLQPGAPDRPARACPRRRPRHQVLALHLLPVAHRYSALTFSDSDSVSDDVFLSSISKFVRLLADRIILGM
jgi:hypothetical protein